MSSQMKDIKKQGLLQARMGLSQLSTKELANGVLIIRKGKRKKKNTSNKMNLVRKQTDRTESVTAGMEENKTAA